MRVVVTGAAGFIGSNLVRHLLGTPDIEVVGFDALTYSGSLASLEAVRSDDRFRFVHADITDRAAVRELFARHRPDAVLHLAAESHVDRSIAGPMAFVQTNVVGTVTLLEEASAAWDGDEAKRFIHVSTDEVFGALGPEGVFTEDSPYRPNSPYAASKAASDHFVRAWATTYGLPTIVTNCSNNYGPFQFPEKLIPLVVSRAMEGAPVPVYGTGSNIRDWLFVGDHCAGLESALRLGKPGATYCFGGRAEVANIDLVRLVLDTFDELTDRPPGASNDLIRFVADRPGHDFRYAIDPSTAAATLGWEPRVDLSEGIRRTVRWYVDNRAWLDAVSSDDHRRFQDAWYETRNGVSDEHR